MEINSFINGIVWGPVMLVFIVGTGFYLTFATKVLQVSGIAMWWRETFGKLFKKKSKVDDENISPFAAVSTALASTVGTGNIAGVATAVFLGGPGAVFWMWVSGFVGMMTKYTEVTLSLKYRETDEKGQYHGGPMYYIKNGLGKNWMWLAAIFAFFGAFATFGIGNMTQSNAIASALERSFNVPVLATGIVIAILVGIVIIGGIKRISSVAEKLVPFMAVFYIIGCIIILGANFSTLGNAFALIFSSAFSFESIGGGILGYAIMRGMRYGIARGVFSNEAGLGSAPIVHAASRNKSPVNQGFYGVFEVFIDTIIICTLSGLVIVNAGMFTGETSGIQLVMLSFSEQFGYVGDIFVTIAIICFAGSTILGWSYYGEQCLGFLTRNNKYVIIAYKVIFAGVAIIGAVGALEVIWDIADTLNGLMAIPNLIAVLLLSRKVFKMTKQYKKVYKESKGEIHDTGESIN